MSDNYDLIIVGGGPAGIAAGIYAARQEMNFLLISKNLGGQMAKKAVDIENYPGFKKISGMDLIQKFEDHLKNFKGRVKDDNVAKINKGTDYFLVETRNSGVFKSETVIIASGADPRPLEVLGEKEFIGRGVSYCSICDGPLYKGKTVAVIGGGNAGFEATIFLSKFAQKIYVLEYSPTIKADKVNQEIVLSTGKVEIITSASIEKIQGNKFVESILWRNVKTEEVSSLKTDGIFIEIGCQPATSFVKDLVSFNKKDEIKIDFQTCQTITPGLFAAGDVVEGRYKQIVIACGQGATAALSAWHYLKNEKKLN